MAEETKSSTVTGVEVISTSLEQTLPQTLARYGSQLSTVTATDIKNNGFVDVTQAIEMLVPGAFVATQAGPFSYVNISIQGSRTQDVLWTVDGVRINNRLYNSTSPADTLPASMVERIEVLKGGQGLFYGTSASAGVINLVTRAFSDKPGGEISLGADTQNGFHGSAYFRDTLAGNKFVLWYSKDESGGYDIYSDYQPNTTNRKRSYDVNSVGAKFGRDLASDLALQASYIHTTANLDYPSVSGNSVNDRTEQVASARLDYTPSDAFKFFLKSYYHTWDTDYYTKPAPAKYWGYRDLGVSGLLQADLHKGFEYNVGYDFQRYHGRDQVLLIDGKTEQVHAVFAQLRSTDDLTKRARFAVGARLNRASGGTNTVWNASGVFDITPNLYISALGGTSFLLPDAEHLYAVDPDDPKGNPDLKPEKSRNLNATLGGRFDVGQTRPLTVELSGWKRRVENLFSSDSSNPPPGYTAVFVNIAGKVNVSGAELDVSLPLGDAFTAGGSYTYSKEIARGTTTQIAGRPRETAKLNLSYAPPSLPFGVDLAVKHVGKVQTTSVVGFGIQQYGGYNLANLSAHAFFDKARRTQLTVRVENAFDEDYATNVASAVRTGSSPAQRFLYRRLGPPRAGFVTLSRRFD